MPVDDRQDRIIRDLAARDDWMDKYSYLIERGRRLAPMDPGLKTDEHAIVGCQSKVWIVATMEDGTLCFTADSDAMITKGLIGLLLDVLDRRRPEEIMDADLYFIDQTGLRSHLSPSRANGLTSIVNQMKRLAAGQLQP